MQITWTQQIRLQTLGSTNNSTQADSDQITELDARSIACAKFQELGETDLDESSFSVAGILRGGEKYYLVSSSKNTVEIKINGRYNN